MPEPYKRLAVFAYHPKVGLILRRGNVLHDDLLKESGIFKRFKISENYSPWLKRVLLLKEHGVVLGEVRGGGQSKIVLLGEPKSLDKHVFAVRAAMRNHFPKKELFYYTEGDIKPAGRVKKPRKL